MTPTTSERELLARIRDLLFRADPGCLGDGMTPAGQPYPIRDEVMDAITAALTRQEAQQEAQGAVAFHAFVKSQGGSVVQREGEYIESMTRLWWTCWKAAIAESEARAVADAANAERMRFVLTVGKLPVRCTGGYYYEDGVLYPTPEAAIDAAQEAEREAGSA